MSATDTRAAARKATTAAIAAVALAASANVARADEPVPAPAAPPPADASVAPAAPAARDAALAPDIDPAWRAYDTAFAQLGRGRRAAARASLIALTTRWPAHPAADQAALRLADLEARAAVRAARSADRVARGEVIFWSTASSVLIARDLCLDTCESDRGTAAVYSLTVGGALGVSLLATSGGVRPAEAQLYNASQTWGSWNALAINDGFAEDRSEAAIAIGGQFAGLAAGLGLWRVWRPEPGDVALANTGLLWGSLLTVWGSLAADREPDLQTVVLLGDVGIVVGAVIAHEVPMSRGRTLLIDLGGVLGSLTGALVTISADSEQAAGTTMFITTTAGLVIAGVATRHWDVKVPAGARLVPTRVGTDGHAGWGAALAIDL